MLISKSHTAIVRETIERNMFPANHFTHKMTRSSWGRHKSTKKWRNHHPCVTRAHSTDVTSADIWRQRYCFYVNFLRQKRLLMHSFNAHDARTGYKAVTNLVLLHMKNMDTRLNAEYALGLKPSCIFWFRLVSIFFICRSTRLVTTLYGYFLLILLLLFFHLFVFRFLVC